VNKKTDSDLFPTQQKNKTQYGQKSFFFHGKIRCLNSYCNTKTGNAFVTESLPKYTISCFFAACSGEKINEVSTNGSAIYAVLSVFAFWVHSLETSERLRLASFLHKIRQLAQFA